MGTTKATTNAEIPLVELTNEAWLTALKGGSRTADAATRARIDRAAGDAANDVAQHARDLIATLTEAVARLESARTPKDAALAVGWLRSDTWQRLQTAMNRLEVLANVLA